MRLKLVLLLTFTLLLMQASRVAIGQQPTATPSLSTNWSDELLNKYVDARAQKIWLMRTHQYSAKANAEQTPSLDWASERPRLKQELLQMLGLDPLPEKTDLKPVVTKSMDDGEVVVENIHFQSRPGLYVTANLYRPKTITQPLPAILYVCGHGEVKIDGISYGNKTHYQHHGDWFARNGYVCLVIDTIQLGEIQGIHHGTYRYGMWWWLNRGYTPAGVEAWNCIRALDYLQQRSEVDPTKLGVTGRSGGGAYSWWIAAIDERIQCAVPVAGITDLYNHINDDCVDGHCDCMFFCNTKQWDFAMVSSLVAPRPLLFANTDNDPIFPLSGVLRTYDITRATYQAHKANDKLGLNITAGGHVDTQELQVHAMRWFNQHLKGVDQPIPNHAVKRYKPQDLKVFDKLPEDQINTTIHETFVAKTPFDPTLPMTEVAFEEGKNILLTECFAAWPQNPQSPTSQNVPVAFDPVEVSELLITPHLMNLSFDRHLPFWRITSKSKTRQTEKTRRTIRLLGADEFSEFQTATPEAIKALAPTRQLPATNTVALEKLTKEIGNGIDELVLFAPSGIGLTQESSDAKKQTSLRRRLMLVGETLDGLQTHDVLMLLNALKWLDKQQSAEVTTKLKGRKHLAAIALHASIFQPVHQLELSELSTDYRNGPIYFNVERYFGPIERATAMAKLKQEVLID